LRFFLFHGIIQKQTGNFLLQITESEKLAISTKGRLFNEQATGKENRPRLRPLDAGGL
jgi:hypothetical protein